MIGLFIAFCTETVSQLTTESIVFSRKCEAMKFNVNGHTVC